MCPLGRRIQVCAGDTSLWTGHMREEIGYVCRLLVSILAVFIHSLIFIQSLSALE